MIKQLFINTAIILVVFGVIILGLMMMDEIRNFDILYFTGSVLSASFILTINNPYNYPAFILGAVSSIILFFALWTTNLNMAYTYLLIFLPCQIYSFFVWKRMNKNAGVLSAPKFLTIRQLLPVSCAFAVVFLIDAYLMYDTGVDFVFLILNSMFLTLALSANILLIKKITDSRIHWVLFSVCGLVLSVYKGEINYYLLSVFVIFLILNIIVLYKWIKNTPPENYGWVKIFRK